MQFGTPIKPWSETPLEKLKKHIITFFSRGGGQFPWKMSSEVKHLVLSIKRNELGKPVLEKGKVKPVLIGGSFIGTVLAGKLVFKDGSKKSVAVKRFDSFKRPMNDEIAHRYENVIRDLAKAEVRIPKMGMLKLEDGEWVQVSQLFGSKSKGSKIVEKSWSIFTTPLKRLEAVTELTKLLNAGYEPDDDLIEPFKDQAKGVIAIDLDTLVLQGKRRQPNIPGFLERIRQYAETKEEFEELFKAAVSTASPQIRKKLVQFKN